MFKYLLLENYDSLTRLRREVLGVVKRSDSQSCERTFAQSLFDDNFSINVRQAVLNTLFFQRMINNTLSPEEYSGYMFQDAVYICDAINALNLAEKNMQSKSLPDFALFYRGRSEKYKSYHSSYFDSKWKITDPKSVKMDPAAATYVAYEMKLAEHNPKFLAIAILPCEMLWPWVAEQINGKVSKTNAYRSWVDNILGAVSYSAQTFTNKFFAREDKAASQAIFNEGIINELNFFRAACDETPVDYSFGYTN